MSFFEISSLGRSHPYFAKMIKLRQLEFITKPTDERGLGEAIVPPLLLLPYNQPDLLMATFSQLANRQFLTPLDAIRYFYLNDQQTLFDLLQLQTSQVTFTLEELAQRVARRKPTSENPPLFLDRNDSIVYQFSMFTAANKQLFIYTLSHLFQDRVRDLQDAKLYIDQNTCPDLIYDLDSRKLVKRNQLKHRGFVEDTYVTDNYLLREVFNLYLLHPEVLVHFPRSDISINELVSNYCVDEEIELFTADSTSKVPRAIKNMVWRKFFPDETKTSALFTGYCFYCRRPIEADNWNACRIVSLSNSGSSDLDNILPSCTSCSHTLRKWNLVDFIRAHGGYGTPVAQYLGIRQPTPPVDSRPRPSVPRVRPTEASMADNLSKAKNYLTKLNKEAVTKATIVAQVETRLRLARAAAAAEDPDVSSLLIERLEEEVQLATIDRDETDNEIVRVVTDVSRLSGRLREIRAPVEQAVPPPAPPVPVRLGVAPLGSIRTPPLIQPTSLPRAHIPRTGNRRRGSAEADRR